MGREMLKSARKIKGMTQQAVADYLHVSLRHYNYIESGKRTGDFSIWDTLEDFLCVHQRKLREISKNRPGLKDNQ